MQILIIGAGVSGLTTGIRLVEEARHEVVIWTDTEPRRTTSHVAGAVWEPFAVGVDDRVISWAKQSYHAFKDLAGIDDAGIRIADALQISKRKIGEPLWASSVDGFRFADPDELPTGYIDGYHYKAPVIDMRRYLLYLQGRFESRGKVVLRAAAQSLGEVFGEWANIFGPQSASDQSPKVIINCAGLRARELLGDTELTALVAARGQIVRIVDANFHLVLGDDNEEQPEEPTYIIPRIDDIVLGGTLQKGDESTVIDAAQRTSILRRCAELARHYDERFAMSLAALVGGEFAAAFAAQVRPQYRATAPAILSDRPDDCGLRPCRNEVRLEQDVASTRSHIVIHNYGHGGAGVTLSWGCADEIVQWIDMVAASG